MEYYYYKNPFNDIFIYWGKSESQRMDFAVLNDDLTGDCFMNGAPKAHVKKYAFSITEATFYRFAALIAKHYKG